MPQHIEFEPLAGAYRQGRIFLPTELYDLPDSGRVLLTRFINMSGWRAYLLNTDGMEALIRQIHSKEFLSRLQDDIASDLDRGLIWSLFTDTDLLEVPVTKGRIQSPFPADIRDGNLYFLRFPEFVLLSPNRRMLEAYRSEFPMRQPMNAEGLRRSNTRLAQAFVEMAV